MADKFSQTSDQSTISTSKAALITDLNSSFVGDDKYSYARNAVRNTKEGDLGTIGNEPSNQLFLLVVQVPWKTSPPLTNLVT
jgi:hypothetical protein